MPSDLFQRALDSLAEEDRRAFERWQSWAQVYTGRSATDPTDGAQVVANVQTESHLVGDEDFGDPSELARFLQNCAHQMSRASDLDGKHQAYLDVCQELAGRGLRMPREHLPDELLRYVPSETLAENLVERMLGKRARAEVRAMAAEVTSARLRAHWDPAKLEPTDRLGLKAEVFATFEHSAEPLGTTPCPFAKP
jgi:hypothetical protein